MWESTPEKILLAIDRDPDPHLLGLVADEARRRGRGVHVVHVVPPTSLHPAAGYAMLRHAEESLRRLLDGAIPPLGVSTELCRGGVLTNLAAESEHACLVVVGRDLVAPGRSPVSSLAARSVAPTMVVPSGEATPVPTTARLVTVAVDDTETSAACVRAGIEEAERRGARLHVVQLCGGGITDLEWGDLIARALAITYDDILAAHPQVAYDIYVARGETVEVLLRHAARSDLLVLGGPGSRFALPGHLSASTRAVLERSSCPVLVVGTPSPVSAARS